MCFNHNKLLFNKLYYSAPCMCCRSTGRLCIGWSVVFDCLPLMLPLLCPGHNGCDTQGALFGRVGSNLEGCCKPGWIPPGSVLTCGFVCTAYVLPFFCCAGSVSLEICSPVCTVLDSTQNPMTHAFECFPSSCIALNHPPLSVGVRPRSADCCNLQQVYISAWLKHISAWLGMAA